mmetsp:Transcript_16181/g.44238  ORF Transcript_16181/g.44238 Transcript_16181/m.44238 type:complete len:82 (+) Transcript_16181:1388-1633(+)
MSQACARCFSGLCTRGIDSTNLFCWGDEQPQDRRRGLASFLNAIQSSTELCSYSHGSSNCYIRDAICVATTSCSNLWVSIF